MGENCRPVAVGLHVLRAKSAQFWFCCALIAGWITGWWGCSGAQVSPLPVLPETPPGYVRVPHPEGMNIGDILAIFTDKDAPSPDSLKNCDATFMKLRTMTDSTDELNEGARELVRADPIRFHWCFYARILTLEEQLKLTPYVDERQKHVLDAYLFLTPIARAYLLEYHDSRYLRWAVSRYRRLSEHVFYRKVELSPRATQELAESKNPFGLLRDSESESLGVLEKYGLVRPSDPVPPAPDALPPTAVLPEAPTGVSISSEPAPASPPAPEAERAPASSPAPEYYEGDQSEEIEAVLSVGNQ